MEYLGNCRDYIDDEDSIFIDATHFAQIEEKSVEITNGKIKDYFTTSDILLYNPDMPDLAMVYDSNEDIHYFYRLDKKEIKIMQRERMKDAMSTPEF